MNSGFALAAELGEAPTAETSTGRRTSGKKVSMLGRFLVRGYVESRKLNLGAATKHGSFIYCGTPSNRDLVGEY